MLSALALGHQQVRGEPQCAAERRRDARVRVGDRERSTT